MSAATEVPQVGGRWSSFDTSHVVARVDPHGAGGFRWLPLCDVSADERLNQLHMLTAGLVPEFRASLPGDRQCPDCQKAGSR